MNAESQTPGKDFLDEYIIGGLAGQSIRNRWRSRHDLVGLAGLVGQAARVWAHDALVLAALPRQSFRSWDEFVKDRINI